MGTIVQLLTPEVRTMEQSMQARWVRELKDMVVFGEGENKAGNATEPPFENAKTGNRVE